MSAQVVITLNNSPQEPTQENVEIFKDIGYCGSQIIDRRYVPSVLHYVSKDIIRKCSGIKNTNAHLTFNSLQLRSPLEKSVLYQNHSFDSIYRLSRLRHCGLDSYLAYITTGKDNLSPCKLHVVKCESENEVCVYLAILTLSIINVMTIHPF